LSILENRVILLLFDAQKEQFMPCTTIGELFDTAAEFEKRVVYFYAELRDKSPDNNVRLLAYYLSRHRKHLSDVMGTCNAELAERIRSTVLPAHISFTPYKDFYIIAKPVETIEGTELIDAAIHYDSSLLHIYNQIIALPIFEQARDKFQTLVDTEKRDLTLLKKMREMHYF